MCSAEIDFSSAVFVKFNVNIYTHRSDINIYIKWREILFIRNIKKKHDEKRLPEFLLAVGHVCTFESSSCFLVDSANDNFDWTRQQVKNLKNESMVVHGLKIMNILDKKNITTPPRVFTFSCNDRFVRIARMNNQRDLIIVYIKISL